MSGRRLRRKSLMSAESSGYTARTGTADGLCPRLRREISEKKCAEGRTTAREHRMPDKKHSNKVVASSAERLAGWFYQLKTIAPVGGVRPPLSAGGARTIPRQGNTCSRAVHGGNRRRSRGPRRGKKRREEGSI